MKISISNAWDETKSFLAREGRLVVPVALATFALPAVLVGWAFPGASPANEGSGGLLLLIAALLVTMIGQMTIVLLVLGWSGSVGQAMAAAARRVPALFGAAVIVFLPLSIIAIVALGAALASAGVTDPATLTPKALLAIPAVWWTSMLFGLLVIFLLVRLYPMPAVAAKEALGPIKLLRRSWALTKGNFGRMLVLFLLLAVGGFVLSSAVTMVVGSISALALGPLKPFTVSALVVAIAGGAVGALVSSVSAAMIGRVYAALSASASTSGATVPTVPKD